MSPPRLSDADREEFKAQQDHSTWRYTDWVQVGANAWRQQTEKFWRVPSEIKDKRYAICQDCEHYRPRITQCSQCGCFMGIKTWVGGFGCPIGLWGVEERE